MRVPQAVRSKPYVGPRSFQTGEALYGRDREVKDLQGLLIAERIVLLHSPSGAGKTSLVQAALIPQLEAEEFTVLPVMRVSLEPPVVRRLSSVDSSQLATDNRRRMTDDGQRSQQVNRYILSVLLSLEEALPAEQQTPPAELARMSLSIYLDRHPTVATAESVVLIFDQFEEIVTVDPTNLAAKVAFFAQVGAALRDRRRWALFSMREDYVAALNPYLRPIPTRLHNTYRLDLLGVAAARQAIQQPARQLGVEFEEAAATRLIDDLRRVHVQQSDGTMEEQLGPSVEPVQLQVVCYRLWEQRFHGDAADLQAGERRITTANLATVGDVNSALADYYAERVAAVASATAVSERAIREWFDDQLITPQGIREQVLQGEGQSQGLDNRAIRALIDAYLVRAEKRRGATWFELAHDRLIEPVRANNTAWREAQLSVLQRQADLWDNQSRPDGLLLRDADLVEAEAWAAAHADELTAVERDFLESCRKVREIIRRARRTNQIIRGLLIVALILAGVASWFFIRERDAAQREAEQRVAADAARDEAVRQERSAVAARDLADRNAEEARREERIAHSRALAAAAVSNLTVDPELSVLLATQAISTTYARGEPVVAETLDALQQAVQTSRVQLTLVGHTEGVQSIAYSPDGTRLATASNDGTIRLWEAATGQPLQTLTGHGAPILDVAYSPDGTRLATGDADGTAGIWEAATGRALLTIKAHAGPISSVAYSSDGKWLATAGADGAARVWAAASGTPVFAIETHAGEVYGVAFSPDGQRLATAGADATAKVWDIATALRTGAAPDTASLTFGSHIGAVLDVAYSPDGARLATAGEDGTACVWDLAPVLGTGKPASQPLYTFQSHASNVYGVAFSPDGAYLATASADATAKLWSLTSGREILTFAGHRDGVFGVTYSPDGLHLATASMDGTARVWHLAFVQPGAATSLTYGPDGGRLATASNDQTARIWDAATGQVLRTIEHDAPVTDVTFSPDGTRLATASGDKLAQVWDAATGKELLILKGHADRVDRVAFSPDGTRLATASNDQTARIWDAATGTPLHVLEGHTSWVYGLAFSPDGTRLASADQNGLAQIWDVDSGQLLRTLTVTDEINDIAFSPDGKLLVMAGESGTAYLWDVTTGQQVRTLRHAKGIKRVAFSSDGTRLATASTDKTAKVWDVASLKELATLRHPTEVLAVAFSPDGTRLATLGADNLVRLYPLDLRALLKLAKQHVTRELTPDECQTYYVEAPCAPAP